MKKGLRLYLVFGVATAMVSNGGLSSTVEAKGPQQAKRLKQGPKVTNPAKKKDKIAPNSAVAPKKASDVKNAPTLKLKAPKSLQRIHLDAAVTQFKEKRYGVSAAVLYDMLNDQRVSAKLKDEAQYHLGKSLYRLKMYQGALHHFTDVLSRGPDSSFYGPSLEWCLFIARKTVADEVVLDAVARYATYEFPAAYESEFRYLLSRFHYLRAIDLEASEAIFAKGKTRIEETSTGGKSFKGDLFGDEEDSDDLAEAEASLKRKGKGGLSLESDIFGFEDEDDDDDDEEEAEDELPQEKIRIMPASLDEYQPQDHIEAATRHAMRVKTTSLFSARAKFIEAVLLYKAGKSNDALELFKSVVRLTKTGAANEDSELRQLAFFQLARTHFGASQPSFSLYYYDKMRRLTNEWLEALYESSWAHFRLGNYEKSLGNLLTLHSPFFVEQYFPESHVLKAVVYYENCRYDEAKGLLADFLKAYEPILVELRRLTSFEQAPEQYYEILANLRLDADDLENTDKALILGKILTIALDDPRVAKLDASYREVVSEAEGETLAKIAKTHDDLAVHLRSILEKVRVNLRDAAGQAVGRRLEQEKQQIQKLIQQAIRIDIETAASEQRQMEASLSHEESTPKEIDKLYVEWTDDEKIVWPFEEEYWGDELGTYELTLGKSCR